MTNSKKTGFATLVAILMTSVMLAIGIAIINITVKEILLASSTRDSVRAFYAADSGIECALYWNERGSFATSTNSVTGQDIECGDDDVTVDVDGANAWRATNTFEIDTGDLCFLVEVYKEDHPGSGGAFGGDARTRIESRGYNTCDENDPRRVERGIRASFDGI